MAIVIATRQTEHSASISATRSAQLSQIEAGVFARHQS